VGKLWKKLWSTVNLRITEFLNLWKTCGKSTNLLTRYLYPVEFSTIAQQFFTAFPQSFPQKRRGFSTAQKRLIFLYKIDSSKFEFLGTAIANVTFDVQSIRLADQCTSPRSDSQI